MNQESIVIDDGRAKLSDLWKKEDFWAIWLGFAVLITGYFLFCTQVPPRFTEILDKANHILQAESAKSPFYTIEYYAAEDSKKNLRARDNGAGKAVSRYFTHSGNWFANPLEFFYIPAPVARADGETARPAAEKAGAELAAALKAAKDAQTLATDAGYKNSELNAGAEAKIAAWRKAQAVFTRAVAVTNQKPVNLFSSLGALMVGLIVFFSIGMVSMGHNVTQYSVGFIFTFVMAVLAFMLGSQTNLRAWGAGPEVCAVILGLFIASTVGTPGFAKPALQTGYYIKTGLVLLGAEALFGKLAAIGIPGICLAWAVTPLVFICTVFVGQKLLKIPSKSLSVTMAASLGVCGAPAALAVASACRAKKEELALVTGLSLIGTVIMLLAMPVLIKAAGMPEVLGGAWMGASIDATEGAAAAGAILGEKALPVAVSVKILQSMLLGVVVFAASLYWNAEGETHGGGKAGKRPRISEIWHRFPKFALGFFAASIVTSLISEALGADLAAAMVDEGLLQGLVSPMRDWCFVLAFMSFGLRTDVRELAPHCKGGKPLLLYAWGQSFNLLLALVLVYGVFCLAFPDITATL